MSYFPLRVVATKPTQEQVNAKIYGRVQIDVITPEGMVVGRMYDGVVRWGTNSNSYFLGPPSRKAQVQGQDKYFDYWRLFPDMERDERDQWAAYIMAQVDSQIQLGQAVAAPAQQQAPAPQQYAPPQQQAYAPPQAAPQAAPPQAAPPQAAPPQAAPPVAPPPQQPAPPVQQPAQPAQPPAPPPAPPAAPPPGPGGPPQIPGESDFPVPPMPQ